MITFSSALGLQAQRPSIGFSRTTLPHFGQESPQLIHLRSSDQKALIRLYERCVELEWFTPEESTANEGILGIGKLGMIQRRHVPAEPVQRFLELCVQKMENAGFLMQEVGRNSKMNEVDMHRHQAEHNTANQPAMLSSILEGRIEAKKAWQTANSQQQRDKILQKLHQRENPEPLFEFLDGVCSVPGADVRTLWTPDYQPQSRRG